MSDLRKIGHLKNLVSKPGKALEGVGIITVDALKTIGALQAFILVKQEADIKPSLIFLYAMVGVIENKHWSKVRQTDKVKLLLALEEYEEFQILCEGYQG